MFETKFNFIHAQKYLVIYAFYTRSACYNHTYPEGSQWLKAAGGRCKIKLPSFLSNQGFFINVEKSSFPMIDMVYQERSQQFDKLNGLW